MLTRACDDHNEPTKGDSLLGQRLQVLQKNTCHFRVNEFDSKPFHVSSNVLPGLSSCSCACARCNEAKQGSFQQASSLPCTICHMASSQSLNKYCVFDIAATFQKRRLPVRSSVCLLQPWPGPVAIMYVQTHKT